MSMPSTTKEASGGHSHRTVVVALSGLLIALLLAQLDNLIVGTAMPTIVGELGGLRVVAEAVLRGPAGVVEPVPRPLVVVHLHGRLLPAQQRSQRRTRQRQQRSQRRPARNIASSHRE